MGRVAAVFAVVIGVGLIGFTFAEQLFSRSSDAQELADHYRPLMSKAGLADLRSGFESLQAAGTELATTAEPQLQAALGMDDAAFAAYRARELPGIAKFDERAPGVVKLVGPVIGQMEAARVDYERADAIPVGFLNLTIAPWLFLGIGALLIAAGTFALVRPGTVAVGALLVVGLGIALAPLVIGIPGKVDSAVRVTALGRVGLAPATGAKAVAATALFDGMVADVRTKLEPAFSTQLGEGAAAGKHVFEATYPTLSGFADEWDASTSAKSHALSDSQLELASTFANADEIPLEPIPWLFIVPGAVLALLSGLALAPARRRSVVVAPAA